MNVKKLICILLVLTVSFFLSSREIPKFTDDLNYLNYIQFSNLHITNLLFSLKENILNLIPKEGLWLFIAYAFSLVFDPITALRVIIFVSSFIFLLTYIKLNNYNFWNTLVLIINPQFLTNYALHIRQGIGISLYYNFKYLLKLIALSVLSIFIHTSFLVFIIYDVFNWLCNRFSLKLIARIYLSILLAFFITIFSSLYFTFFSDNKKDIYNGLVSETSGFGFLFWLITLGLILSDYKKISIGYYKWFLTIVFGMSFYLFSYYLNSYGARVLENFLPLIVLVVPGMSNHKKILIYFMLVSYSIFQWIVRGGFNF